MQIDVYFGSLADDTLRGLDVASGTIRWTFTAGGLIRFEALRLGVQECEARIFVERMLYDEEKKAALGEELAKKARALLDARVEEIMRAKQDRSGMYSVATDASWLWYAGISKDRARELYALAAEAQAKSGGTAIAVTP